MVPDLSRDASETRVFRAPEGPAIAGPAGYCIDPENSRASVDGGFVLLGGCDILAGARRGPQHYAILSASYAPASSLPRAADYAGFLSSERGRAMLSRASDARTVGILSSEVDRDILYLHVRDTSPNEGARLAPEHWRAAFFHKGHALMLSVHSTADAPVSARDGRVKIGEFVRAVRRAN